MAINFALECAAMNVKKSQQGFGLNVIPQILPCAVDCYLLGQQINNKHVSHARL
jgi:hypothetical protein